jgi:hypothetical protein
MGPINFQTPRPCLHTRAIDSDVYTASYASDDQTFADSAVEQLRSYYYANIVLSEAMPSIRFRAIFTKCGCSAVHRSTALTC